MDRVARSAQIAMIVLGTVAAFAALDSLQSIAAPVALALVVGVVLSPLSDFWERIGFAPVIGALTSVFATLLLLAATLLAFQPVVAGLIDMAPKVWADMAEVIASARALLARLSRATSDMSAAIGPAPPDTGLDLGLPSVGNALLFAPAVVGQIMIFAGALFFFLHSRTAIYQWAARHLSGPTETAETAARLHSAEHLVSRYFLTITLINVVLGLATGVTLQIMGLPGAALWAVLAGLFNYIVYVGPALLALLLLFAGVAAFDGAMILLPAAAFIVLNTIEGQIITPALVGKHLEVNPLLIFLALVFGLWLWGPIGGIVAIPLLLWVLVLNDALGSR
ncbi:MAG: AI-2E family transporter [Pseudorhodobacter sp.]|nr:AI-2E family transporter [Pseudorhodobacter sp.]